MVENRAKNKRGHEYGGQKKDEMILWDGGVRGSQVANTELVCARASENEGRRMPKKTSTECQPPSTSTPTPRRRGATTNTRT